jgi:hypothetical protein
MLLHFQLPSVRAEVAGRSGRSDEEREALEQALAVAEAKGNRVLEERIRARLD